MQLKPPHPHHYPASKVYEIQYELYRNQNWKEEETFLSETALVAGIECREAILTFPNRKTACMIQDLGKQ
jgi:hypothetical protein